MSCVSNSLPLPLGHLLLSLLLSLFFLAACSSEEEEQQQLQLRQRLEALSAAKEQDERLLTELIQELDGINSYVDSLDLLTGEDDVDRLDALGKVQLLDSLIQAKNKTVDSLSAQLDRNDPLLKRELNRYRQQAQAYQNDLDNLAARLEESEAERVSLQQTVREQLATIRSQDQQLSSLEAEKKAIMDEVEKARQEQKKLQRENEMLEAKRAKRRESVASTYYQSGRDMYEVAEKMNKLFNGKKKRELTLQAHELLTEAAKLGNLNAKRLAFDIKQQYPKYFE